MSTNSKYILILFGIFESTTFLGSRMLIIKKQCKKYVLFVALEKMSSFSLRTETNLVSKM